jgi:hypothetical protein
MSNNTRQELPKKRRVSRACDYCHQRSKRCRASSHGEARCQACVAFDQSCTFDRPQKRRGTVPRQLRDEHDRHENHDHHGGISQTSSVTRAHHPTDINRSAASAWQPSHLSPVSEFLPAPIEPAECTTTATTADDVRQAPPPPPSPRHYSHATIVDLVDLFFEIVYPMFPLFHQPSFTRRISRSEYTSDTSLFAVTMAVCALVGARVRDGAVFNPRWDLTDLKLQSHGPDVYYTEAIRQLGSVDDAWSADVNVLRTHAILALAAIQDGKVRDMHRHLGRYHTIVAVEGLHDESNWPRHIGLIEKEERRRIFWSLYTLDVFTSIVWGGVICSREYQSNVAYPSEADDDMFDDSGFASADSPEASHHDKSGIISWIAGRNFVVDLYRVLEHINMRLCARSRRAQRQTPIDGVLQASDSLSQEAVLHSVLQMYADLPPCLKSTPPLTSKPRMDRFGFQAADIIATVQLLRMVLLSATGASTAEKCQIANDVVSAFIAVPTEYHRAISAPLLFHIGVIGQILAATLEQPLSEDDYSSIRSIVMSMIQLLSSLEGLHASRSATQRLKDQITCMDEYMTLQRNGGRQQQRYTSTSSGPNSTTIGAASLATLPSSPSAFGLQAIGSQEETMYSSPFQLPSEILGDFSQIFDFSDLSGTAI